MPVLNYQDILNTICTQSKARLLFFDHRAQFYVDYNVNDEQLILFFNQLNKAQVNFFSQSLLAKRKHAVMDLLPLTTKILDNKFHEIFNEFAQKFVPDGIHKHHIDAIHFCRFLKNKNDLRLNKIINSVIHFENDLIQSFLKPRRFSLKLYYFDLKRSFRSINDNDSPFKIKASISIILWNKGHYRVLWK